MSDPLMLAMSQSGIIQKNVPDNKQILPVKQIKISNFVLPKRIIQAPSNVLRKRIQLKPLAIVKEDSGVFTRMKRPGSGSPGDLEGNSKKLKPMMNNIWMMNMEPVLSQIFGGTFARTEAFNVQV